MEDFKAIWRGVLDEARIESPGTSLGFGNNDPQSAFYKASELLTEANGHLGPNNVRQALRVLSEGMPVVVFLDEFDRIENHRTRNQIADLIKLLADGSINARLVLVGVGETVGDLVAEHESISRSLVQIPMPRMSEDEIVQIVNRGAKAAGIHIEADFTSSVTTIAQGLPHYAHLLCQHGALSALRRGRLTVSIDDFASAVTAALNDVSETVRGKYYRATVSNQKTIYKEVLLACALAQTDDSGTFAPADVKEQLFRITGNPYEFSGFSTHLRDFSADVELTPRGGILMRKGESHGRYKFRDPLLPSYVLMRGLKEGLFTRLFDVLR